MSSDEESVKLLSELLQGRLSKDPKLDAKQGRLLAILAARELAKAPGPGRDAAPERPWSAPRPASSRSTRPPHWCPPEGTLITVSADVAIRVNSDVMFALVPNMH